MPKKINENINVFTPLVAVALCLGTILALSEILRPWIIAIWAVSALSIIFVSLKGQITLFTQWIRAFITIFLILIEIFMDRFSEWQLVLAQVLVILLAVKLLELKTQRDIYQIAGLSLLALGVASFLRVDLTLGFIILWVITTSIILMLWQQIYEVIREKKRDTRRFGPISFGWISLSGICMSLSMIPLTIFFFLILPRTPTPLWRWAPQPGIARTGFSPEMSPGSVSKIVQDNSVAFRAKISPEPKNPEDLYWTGAVLWKMKGENWLPGHPTNFQKSWPHAPWNIPTTTQTIILPPISESYLFALPYPVRVEGLYGIIFNRDGTIKLSYPQRLPVRYEVTSVQGWKQELLPEEKKAGLEVPARLDPRILELAQRLKEKGNNPYEIAMSTVRYLASPPFSYSLSAPPGFKDGQTLSDFLFKTHTGYCEFYASALSLLLRLNGIHARTVVGYKGGEFNPMGDYWLIRESMAHAWTEAWIDEKGWMILDATPSIGLRGTEAKEISAGARHYLPSFYRLWDWMQWQWQNFVIDLTPAKQRKIWFETGQRLGRLVSWDISWLKINDQMGIKGYLRLPAYFLYLFLILALTVTIFFIKRYRIKKEKGIDLYRRLAAKRLEKATPIKEKLIRPGMEGPYWRWWKDRRPDCLESLKKIYYSQRYGKNPTKEGDEMLKKILKEKKNE